MRYRDHAPLMGNRMAAYVVAGRGALRLWGGLLNHLGRWRWQAADEMLA